MIAQASERASLAGALVAGAVVASPLWLAPLPLAQDLPAHIETSAQLLDLWRGGGFTAGVVEVHPFPAPNALPVVLLAALLAVLPPLIAAKLMLTGAVVAWPLSLWALAKASGRSGWLAVLAAPTALDFAFGYGFFNFVVGKPLLVLSLALALSFARDPRRAVGVGLFACVTTLFFVHMFLWGLAGVLCGVVLVLEGEGLRRRLLSLLPLALAGLVGLPGVLATQATPGGQTTFEALPRRLAQLWDHSGGLVDGAPGVGCAVAWILVVAAALGVAVVVRVGGVDVRTRGLAVVVLLLLVAWLFGPERLPFVSVVSSRALSLAVALALLLPTLPPRSPSAFPRCAAGIAAVVAMAAVVQAASVTAAWRQFSRDDTGDVVALLRQLPPGARLATHYTRTSSTAGPHNALWHWPKLHAALSGGFTDDSFAWRTTTFVRLTPAARRSGFAAPHRLQAAGLSRFSHLIVGGPAAGAERKLRGQGLSPTRLGESGAFTLYRLRSTTTGSQNALP